MQRIMSSHSIFMIFNSNGVLEGITENIITQLNLPHINPSEYLYKKQIGSFFVNGDKYIDELKDKKILDKYEELFNFPSSE